MIADTPYAQMAQDLQRRLLERCEKDRIAGMSLTLADTSGPVLSVAHGYADLFARTPFTPDTLLGVASVSKLFTATGIMQLAEAGTLDIHAPVQAYIPEFTIQSRDADAPPIRVIDLMTHHSGIPRDWLNHFYAFDPEPFDTVVDRLRGELACRPAGYYYSYSNMAIALLGTVLQRASGIPFETYIKERVLRPIGMAHSSFAKEYAYEGLYAQTYDGLLMKPELPLRDKPGGGLYASTRELACFMAAYLSGGAALLSPGTVDRMFTPQLADAPMSFGKRMGLGWHLNRPALEYAGRVAHHGGALVYSRSEVCILPDHGLGVALIANSSTATQAILELAEECLQEALRIKAGIQPSKTPVPFVRRQGVDIAPPEGHYATSRGYVHIEPAAGGYAFRWNGRRLLLKPAGEDTYRLHSTGPDGDAPDDRFTGAPLRFCRDPRTGGTVLLIGTWPDGEAFTPAPVPDAWQGRLGRYRACNRMPEEALTDIPHTLVLKIKKGLLFLEVIGPGYRYERVLMPEGDTRALRLGWGQEEQTAVYADRDGADMTLRHMGIIFRKV